MNRSGKKYRGRKKIPPGRNQVAPGGPISDFRRSFTGKTYVTLKRSRSFGLTVPSRDMVNRKIYTGDYKARIVLECIQGKKSLLELAEQYDVHPNQIKNWKSYFLKQAAFIFEDKRRKKKIDAPF